MSKKLVAYFSASGNTAKLADSLAAAADAKMMSGKRFSARASENELKDWVAGLNLE